MFRVEKYRRLLSGLVILPISKEKELVDLIHEMQDDLNVICKRTYCAKCDM